MSTFNIEVESPVSAARLFKAAVLDGPKLVPQLVPEIFGTTVVQGNGLAVGNERQYNLTPEIPYSYVKDRLDFVDHDKFEMKTTLVELGPVVAAAEGAKLGFEATNKTYHVKLEPTSNGGCIYRMAIASTIGADEEAVQAKTKEIITAEVKAVEAYLLANPNAYT